MPRPLLVEILLTPRRVDRLTLGQWDLLIRQARRANLIARLATLLEPRLAEVPFAPRQHLHSALLIAQRQRIAARWEAECIRTVLRPLGVQPILLKGAAYLLADLPAARGRLFGDIDLLVPKASINAVEAALIAAGWAFDAGLSDYDQRYYRQWMHEFPPLRHQKRDTALDLHHTILPPTARVQVNTAALFEDTYELPGLPGLHVLAPVTMFLHSATHLFHEGEFDNGLRDLFDLDSLMRDFGARPDFWNDLIPRAQILGVTRPLFLALRYTSRLLGTPVPDDVLRQATAADAPRWQAPLDICYERALMPTHASCADALSGPARLALYARSHWLRMPFALLVAHLGRKAWLRLLPPADTPPS